MVTLTFDHYGKRRRLFNAINGQLGTHKSHFITQFRAVSDGGNDFVFNFLRICKCCQ